MKLGDVLKKERENKGLSVDEVAATFDAPGFGVLEDLGEGMRRRQA